MQDRLRQKITLDSPIERHWDETFRMMANWDAEKIRAAKVMVVGAGALGNEVLKNLALLNVGHILVVDFDTIEYANLCRSVLFREADCQANRLKCEVAAERVRDLNPNVKTFAIKGDIWLDVGLGIFRRMDVVIGCLDNRLARQFINRHAHRMGKTWVDGAIENLDGEMHVYRPGTSCYECQLSDAEKRIIQYRLGCADMAIRNSNQGKIPTTPISSSIIGAMQVQEAMKVVFGDERHSLAGQYLRYYGMRGEVLQGRMPGTVHDECESHYQVEDIIEAPELTSASSVGDTLAWLAQRFGTEQVAICLHYQLILEIATQKTDIPYPVVIAKPHFSDAVARQYQAAPGENVVITRSVVDVDDNFPRMEATLRQIGVPPLHILTVKAGGSYFYVELTGDEGFLRWE